MFIVSHAPHCVNGNCFVLYLLIIIMFIKILIICVLKTTGLFTKAHAAFGPAGGGGV